MIAYESYLFHIGLQIRRKREVAFSNDIVELYLFGGVG